MRLISKFHDYYDGALKAFYSEDPVYIRKSEDVILISNAGGSIFKKEPTCTLYDNIYRGLCREDDYDRIIVGFCGKIYYMIKKISDRTPDAMDDKWINVDYAKFMECHNAYYRYLFSGLVVMPDVSNMKAITEDMFVTLDAPIYAMRYDVHGSVVAEKNPELKRLGFASVIDPYTAVQELQMFIGNQLAHDGHPEMPVGSDKVIAESKGFDKYSFRKPKQR